MDRTQRGSFRLFRAAGIDVFLHWSWFLVALWQITSPRGEFEYLAHAWKVAEYLALFAIVTLHEFGHALACRSVGGKAERIVLWPLGGIAYVAPPMRPGPVLWSIAAGPLVNFVLVVPLFAAYFYGRANGWPTTHHDLDLFTWNLACINLGLLIFNVLPVYPLDGGQILHALLWFAVGQWTSLLIASLIGMVLGGCLLLFAILLIVMTGSGAILFGLVAVFLVLRSLAAFQHARAVLALQALPRHDRAFCPHCHVGPPRGPHWVCEHCQTRFDLFDHKGHCPACGAWFLHPTCPHCYQKEHIDRWFVIDVAPREGSPLP